MARHEHMTKLQNLILDLRKYSYESQPGAWRYKLAEGLEIIFDELAAIDAAARDSAAAKGETV